MSIARFLKKINLESAWDRFPLVLISASLFTCLLLLMSEGVFPEDSNACSIVVRATWALMMLFITSLLLELLDEKYPGISTLSLYAIPIVFSLVYFFIIPHYPNGLDFVKHVVLFAGINLLCLLLVYHSKNEEFPFWNNLIYSVLLFLETTVFSLFLMASISFAIVALEKLFGLDYGNFKIYQNLFILIAAAFHPIYALSRIESYEYRSRQYKINTLVRIFAGKILLPVVLLYASILAAYMVKILIEWSWPKGWISSMIIWFAILGFLSFILNKYIYKQEERSSFVRLFQGLFFPFLFLCSIVLALAIRVRILQYGVTEPRYVVGAIALFLFIVSAIYSLSKSKDIRLAFAIFWGISFLTVFGPVNMFDVSIKSQLDQLKEVLEKNGLLAEQDSSVPDIKTQASISQKLLFLEQRDKLHEIEALSERFHTLNLNSSGPDQQKLDVLLFYKGRNWEKKNSDLQEVCKLLGFDYAPYRVSDDAIHFSFHTNRNQRIELAEYDQLILINSAINDSTGSQEVSLSKDHRKLLLQFKDKDSINVNEIFVAEQNPYHKNDEPLREYEYMSDSTQYRFLFRNYSGMVENDSMKIDYFEGFLLIKNKN